ncbi:hypothetical protein CW304_11855 [Bacillus sp. UFRGS-B20]|nr:hypothetical protein CW304_11855 [Bacillus sp. UFRGS-B20]
MFRSCCASLPYLSLRNKRVQPLYPFPINQNTSVRIPHYNRTPQNKNKTIIDGFLLPSVLSFFGLLFLTLFPLHPSILLICFRSIDFTQEIGRFPLHCNNISVLCVLSHSPSCHVTVPFIWRPSVCARLSSSGCCSPTVALGSRWSCFVLLLL